MKTKMADDLILADCMAPNLTLSSDMQTNDVVRKQIWWMT